MASKQPKDKQHGGTRDIHRAREKERIVLRLRSEGYNYDEIAAHVPSATDSAYFEGNRSRLYAARDGAYRAYRRALDRITANDAREALERDLYRVEEVMRAHLPRAVGGDGESARIVLRGFRDRARVLGYSAAATGRIPQEIVDLVESIRELREDP